MSYKLRSPNAQQRYGQVILCLGILMYLFLHPATQPGRNWLHSVIGFSLGLGVTMILMSQWNRRRRGCEEL